MKKRTYCNEWRLEDDDSENISILSQLVLANLRKNDSFKIAGKEYKVTVQTPNTLRVIRVTGTKRIYSFRIDILEEHGCWCCNIGRGPDLVNEILREIEGDLVVDSINIKNPLHKISDVGNILKRDPIFS